MNELEIWYAANEKFLTETLDWLRDRLERFAKTQERSDRSQPAADSHAANRGTASSPASSPFDNVNRSKATPSLDPSDPAAPAPRLPPALTILSERLGLTVFERSVLFLCAAMEFDPDMGALCARAQRDAYRAYPTFALALKLFDQPEWSVLSPERPLRYWRLIEINQPGSQPLTSSALRADERIVNYLKGLNYLDDRLASLLLPLQTDAAPLPPSQRQPCDCMVEQLRRASGDSSVEVSPVVQLLGSDRHSKRTLAVEVGRALGLTVYKLTTEMLPTAWSELEPLVRLYERESRLAPMALYLDSEDSDKEWRIVRQLLDRTSGLVFVDAREPWLQPDRPVLSLDVSKPLKSEQLQAWLHALAASGDEPDSDRENVAYKLAAQFNFNLSDIERIARSVNLSRSASGQPLSAGLWSACLLAARPRMESLAQRLEIKNSSWDDLVLPETESLQLQRLIDQVCQRRQVYESWGFEKRMSRGLGINALFAGESGTGKTLAAEVIAQQLQLTLYRIDLSQVVSKYIGETEKNLRKLFDAAEDGGSILFFDEADSLFGKRSEVRDSHDRYANIEINYLLQRMEAYRGLAILATNMKSALDNAFIRRLRFIISFPFPGQAERLRIWQRAFPEQSTCESIDYERLARFHLTGGSIQNSALNAAFLAASAECPISMPLIFEAIRGEFRKLEKPINESEFRLAPSEARA